MDLEKFVFLNDRFVRGYEVIDVIKVVLEKVCFRIVLCVDILVIVYCDLVVEVYFCLKFCNIV